MEENITEKLDQAQAKYPAGLECTTPMGTSFTTTGLYHHDSRGNIFDSNWQFIYCRIYDEWAVINPDQPQQANN